MEMFSLGGIEEARILEEGGPTVPADVVMFWYQSHSGYDPPQRTKLWWAFIAFIITLSALNTKKVNQPHYPVNILLYLHKTPAEAQESKMSRFISFLFTSAV